MVADLQQAIGAAQVKFDHMSRTLYSSDASNYQIMPIGVTFPRHADDVCAIHEIAQRYHAPILPRGSGSSLGGQAVGYAVVMDFTRHLRRVRGIHAEGQTITVEPGLVLGQLNKQVQSFGLMFGPDPASAERASVGGCIANNSTGAHSILYGMTADHIQRLEVVLPSGEKVWLDAQNATLAALRAQMRELVLANQAEIEACYPKTWRTVAGYALNQLDPNNINLDWLVAGSEGTLATIVQAELKLVPRPPAHLRRLVMVHFESLRESLEATPLMLETQPSAIELMDRFLIRKTRQSKTYAPLLTVIEGDPAAVQIVEFYGESEAELSAKAQNLKQVLHKNGYPGPYVDAVTPQQQADIWEIRKAGLGLITSERGDTKPIDLIEDAAVPVKHLADYIERIDQIITQAGTTYAIYAHASAGCLHVRPLINLKTAEGLRQYRRIGSEAADAVIKYGGTISGEHGTGLIRGEFSDRLFGPQLVQAFRQVKAAFDPNYLMNPGKMVDHPAMDDISLLRHKPDEPVLEINTYFDWSADGGFMGAIEMCNGAGVCRKEGSGTMCPSYMATLDEAHATRGRANALRAAMTGHFDPVGLGSPEVYGVFDLCLSCKACQSECPSSVDVARMKAEFLAQYHDQHGTPWSTWAFANIHRLNALGSLAPRLTNALLQNPVGKQAAKALGLPTQRPLPTLTPHRFSRQADPQPTSISPSATLIVDTFTEFNHPEVGAALLKVVTALGLRLRLLRLPEQGCCGRPAISKGGLSLAKSLAEANIGRLAGLLDHAPFLFLEPSCQSAFTDDYLTLVAPDLQASARLVAERCQSAESWLANQLAQRGERLEWDQLPRQLLLHGHCHQKALWGTAGTKRLLASIPGASVTEIDSGCCGVAGSFGYEHYDLSLKIANQRLLPAIQAAPQALVVAPGTSCRTQISEAGHRVWHPIEMVASALA
jgi:FAD/FMN-containing dehydrogenase/Fe-S oxidoreductase